MASAHPVSLISRAGTFSVDPVAGRRLHILEAVAAIGRCRCRLRGLFVRPFWTHHIETRGGQVAGGDAARVCRRLQRTVHSNVAESLPTVGATPNGVPPGIAQDT